MALTYDIEEAPGAEEVAKVFCRSGIRRPAEDLPRIQKMIDHANLIVCARDGGKLVGLARCLTDFCYCCYLSDLAVDRAYQRRGIGKELTRRVREAIGEEAAFLLLAAPEARDYYAPLGFEKAGNAWIIRRKR